MYRPLVNADTKAVGFPLDQQYPSSLGLALLNGAFVYGVNGALPGEAPEQAGTARAINPGVMPGPRLPCPVAQGGTKNLLRSPRTCAQNQPFDDRVAIKPAACEPARSDFPDTLPIRIKCASVNAAAHGALHRAGSFRIQQA